MNSTLLYYCSLLKIGSALPFKVWFAHSQLKNRQGRGQSCCMSYSPTSLCRGESGVSRLIQENTYYYSLILHNFQYFGAAISSSAFSHPLFLLFLVSCLVDKDIEGGKEEYRCRSLAVSFLLPLFKGIVSTEPVICWHLYQVFTGCMQWLTLRNLTLVLWNILRFQMFDHVKVRLSESQSKQFWCTMLFLYILFMLDAGSSITL